MVLPTLKPDLVLYGMCLNDFLPDHHHQDYFGWPFPERLKRMFVTQTCLGGILNNRMDHLLMRWHLQPTFFSDISEDLPQRIIDFDSDMQNVAKKTRSMMGLSPIALVLNSMPENPESFKFTQIAEDCLLRDGFHVIPAIPYLTEARDHQYPMHLSRWEWHPDAFANKIYADLFLQTLLQSPDVLLKLKPYRKKALTGA